MTLVTVWLISKERACFIHDTVRSPGEESSSFRNALYIARYMCLKMTGRVFWPSSDVLQHHSYIAPRDKSFSFHEPAWSSNSQHGNLQQRVTGNSDAKKLYTHIAKEKKRNILSGVSLHTITTELWRIKTEWSGSESSWKVALLWKRWWTSSTSSRDTYYEIFFLLGCYIAYVERSIFYLPKQERRQWADWNKSVHVGTCLEVSHMQPQLSAILTVRVTACQVNLCVRFLRNCSIWSKDQL